MDMIDIFHGLTPIRKPEKLEKTKEQETEEQPIETIDDAMKKQLMDLYDTQNIRLADIRRVAVSIRDIGKEGR